MGQLFQLKAHSTWRISLTRFSVVQTSPLPYRGAGFASLVNFQTVCCVIAVFLI